MKKKNPFHWDLSGLPEDQFKTQRSLSIYRKDVDESRIIQRGRIKARVGKYKRKDTIESWLPNTNLYLVTKLGICKHFNLTRIKWNWLVDNQENIRSFVGADEDDIVLIDDTQISAEDTYELYTPFMMLHDVYEFFSLYPGRFGSSRNVDEQIQKLVSENFIYVPILLHLILKDSDNLFDFEKSNSTFLTFIRDTQNQSSDLFALWCKNEKLFPHQFQSVERIKGIFDKMYGQLVKIAKHHNIDIENDLFYPDDKRNFYILTRINPRLALTIILVKHFQPKLSIEEFCEQANFIFSDILDRMKGKVITTGKIY